jgi:hypothetical protein
MARPRSHSPGVYAGAMKPAALADQAQDGQMMSASQLAK